MPSLTKRFEIMEVATLTKNSKTECWRKTARRRQYPLFRQRQIDVANKQLASPLWGKNPFLKQHQVNYRYWWLTGIYMPRKITPWMLRDFMKMHHYAQDTNLLLSEKFLSRSCSNLSIASGKQNKSQYQ